MEKGGWLVGSRRTADGQQREVKEVGESSSAGARSRLAARGERRLAGWVTADEQRQQRLAQRQKKLAGGSPGRRIERRLDHGGTERRFNRQRRLPSLTPCKNVRFTFVLQSFYVRFTFVQRFVLRLRLRHVNKRTIENQLQNENKTGTKRKR